MRLPTESGEEVLGRKVAEMPPLNWLLPSLLERGTEGLTYSKIKALWLCLLLARLFLFLLIKNRCICPRTVLGALLRPGCSEDYSLHRQSV